MYAKNLQEVAKARVAWAKGLSPEDQSKVFRMADDEEEDTGYNKEQRMEDYKSAFEMATSTGEVAGLLTTKDQNQIFMVIVDWNAKAKGRPHMSFSEDMSERVKDLLWQLYNDKNPETKGISLDDIV